MENEHEDFELALRNCESEPIHIPGHIQSHGALLVVSPDLSEVLQVSANIEQFLGITTDCALGNSLSAVLGEENAQKIPDLPIRGDSQPSVPTLFRLNDGAETSDLIGEVHRVRGDWVIEIEPSNKSEREHFASLFVSIRDALWDSDTEQNLATYCRLVADQVRRLTGFDRALVYRFDHNWNGEVLAESRNDRLPSLLGHHFPASDIPAQARDLYVRNAFRALADIDAPTVSLDPSTHPLTGEALDMSHCVFRSMSPIHIEYLRNMGARASMSISLIVGGKLWGLIACHHVDPKHVPFDVRGLALFIGTTASVKLNNLESSARGDYLERVQQTLLSVTRQITKCGDVEKALSTAEGDILGLFNATGSIVCINGRRYGIGQVPSAEQVDTLVNWLSDNCDGDVFVTDCLQHQYPAAGACAEVCAGLLAVRLDSHFSNFTLWFRKETVQSIPWAGEPQKSLVRSDYGLRIAPRTSFAQWVEEQHNHSLPWTATEAESAQIFAQMVNEMLTQTALKLNAPTEARLKFLADHDHLTGLPNRRLLTEKLNSAVASAEANNRDLAVLFIDLDHFKAINDTLGHLAGDRYLQEIAQRLKANLRHDDTLGRWGGDEFVAVIERLRSREPLEDTLARLRSRLSAPLRLEEHDITPSASIGVARYPEDGTNALRLMQAADSAMYRIKKSGRQVLELNRQTPSQPPEVSFELGWQLHRALTERELQLHYQPQFRTDTGALVGLEALLRWNHPAHGLIKPPAFLPTAEGVGVMRKIGDWVLQTVCGRIAEWQPIMPPSSVIAMNVAPAELDSEFAERAVQAVNVAGIAAERLSFELTEHALERRQDVIAVLRQCTDAGIRLTIDEFGTGYMSLAQLRELSISNFKIDQRFVNGAITDERDAAIVRSVVAIGASLGIDTIAQGVETQEQLEFLRSEGVGVVQGFLLGQPMSEDEVPEFLTSDATVAALIRG